VEQQQQHHQEQHERQQQQPCLEAQAQQQEPQDDLDDGKNRSVLLCNWIICWRTTSFPKAFISNSLCSHCQQGAFPRFGGTLLCLISLALSFICHSLVHSLCMQACKASSPLSLMLPLLVPLLHSSPCLVGDVVSYSCPFYFRLQTPLQP
jgi:hypothetical protein